MSKYAGERFDLIQAGGGNSSVKFEDGTMAIKASGYILSDLDTDRGYSIVNNLEVTRLLSHPDILSASVKKEREDISNRLLKDTIRTPENRPSIETFLHALLSKYTLHTHPVTVNAITCLPNWKEKLNEIFGPEILLVEYETPGIDLALRLKQRFEQFIEVFSHQPKIVFLQNHGLIVSSDNYEDIQYLTDEVTFRIEGQLNINLGRYRLTNRISKLVNDACGKKLISYLSEDKEILNFVDHNRTLFSPPPFFPDGLVFLGYKILFVSEETAHESIKDYMDQYHDEPKVILMDGRLFLLASNVRKAREMEDVLKLHLLALHLAPGQVQSLKEEELRYLGNWEAEKFRQKL
jgi:rhamnose utilization protein RhaD (predicted bifunctional aldolase and dehydrogenase)